MLVVLRLVYVANERVFALASPFPKITKSSHSFVDLKLVCEGPVVTTPLFAKFPQEFMLWSMGRKLHGHPHYTTKHAVPDCFLLSRPQQLFHMKIMRGLRSEIPESCKIPQLRPLSLGEGIMAPVIRIALVCVIVSEIAAK